MCGNGVGWSYVCVDHDRPVFIVWSSKSQRPGYDGETSTVVLSSFAVFYSAVGRLNETRLAFQGLFVPCFGGLLQWGIG